MIRAFGLRLGHSIGGALQWLMLHPAIQSDHPIRIRSEIWCTSIAVRKRRGAYMKRAEFGVLDEDTTHFKDKYPD
jgi:hypothetical protein